MKINFYAPVHFEKWNWENSIKDGIGGSETSTVEMSWRLAAKGCDVTVYAPLPENSPNEWRNVKWYPIEQCNFEEKGLWVLYRCPEAVDKIKDKNGKILWLLMQDWDHPDSQWYGGETKTSRIEKLDAIVVLCEAHRKWLVNRRPDIKNKTIITRNGIKDDLIKQIEKENIVRNPKRIMYASSPDRGMLSALQIFERAQEKDPELELHLTYGFNNIDKLIKGGNKHFQRDKDQCLKLIEKTGAVLHGRLSQNELYKMWFQTAMTVYCTTFWETGWITGLEASAMGAIPIFSPIWAQGENMKFGVAIQGHPSDPLTIARFANAVVSVAANPQNQELIRKPMMQWSRCNWSWDKFVDQWIEYYKESL